MKGRELRFGLIGFGKMGKIRYRTLVDMAQCNVVAVYEEKEEMETPVGLDRYGTVEEVVSQQNVDAVIIGVPNYLIKPCVIAALQSGKHVFCEKPPGMNLAETLAMQEVLKDSGCKLMFGFNHRHHQSIIKAKETVDSHYFGEILWMRGRYGKSVPREFFDDWRSKKKYAGGGIFLDQGIHMLDLFMHFAGTFDEIHSFVSNLYWKGDVEDNVFAIFRNRKGQVASLHSTMTQWRHLFSLEIFLERGYIVLNGLKTSTNSYGDEQLTIAVNRSHSPAATWTEHEQYQFTIDDSWKRELTLFRDTILEDVPIKHCGIEDAVRLMEMTDRIYA